MADRSFLGPVCGYCGSASVLRDGAYVYGVGYAGRFKLWVCSNYPSCDAFVGCHHNSPKSAPKGSLANEQLRKLRIQVHHAFDLLWKADRSRINRSQAYNLLSDLMGMERGKCHIGWFNDEECAKALSLLEKA